MTRHRQATRTASRVLLLPEHRDVVALSAVGLDELFSLHEHPAGAAGRVSTRPSNGSSISTISRTTERGV